MPEIKELTIEKIDIIKNFFKDIFTREPWNDDWSDDEQLHQYITDIIGNRNSLAFGLFEGEQLLGLALGNIKHWYTGTEFSENQAPKVSVSMLIIPYIGGGLFTVVFLAMFLSLIFDENMIKALFA